MKKLVPMFLSGILMLSSSNVFANNVVENAEFINSNVTLAVFANEDDRASWPNVSDNPKIETQQLHLGKNFLVVQMAGVDNIVPFINYSEISLLLMEIFPHFQMSAYLNNETNTIELIDESWTNQMSELKVVDPIDMSNINRNEWINVSFIHTLENRSNYSSLGMGQAVFDSDGFNVYDWTPVRSLSVQRIENFEFESVFESIVGCNTADIRVIEFNLGSWDFYVNIHDLVNLNILEESEVLELLEREAVYETIGAYLLAQSLNSYKESISSGMFSDEQLAKIIASIELQLS